MLSVWVSEQNLPGSDKQLERFEQGSVTERASQRTSREKVCAQFESHHAARAGRLYINLEPFIRDTTPSSTRASLPMAGIPFDSCVGCSRPPLEDSVERQPNP